MEVAAEIRDEYHGTFKNDTISLVRWIPLVRKYFFVICETLLF